MQCLTHIWRVYDLVLWRLKCCHLPVNAMSGNDPTLVVARHGVWSWLDSEHNVKLNNKELKHSCFLNLPFSPFIRCGVYLKTNRLCQFFHLNVSCLSVYCSSLVSGAGLCSEPTKQHSQIVICIRYQEYPTVGLFPDMAHCSARFIDNICRNEVWRVWLEERFVLLFSTMMSTETCLTPRMPSVTWVRYWNTSAAEISAKIGL